jgi:L-rhamnose isomerase
VSDGYKDTPIDRMAAHRRLEASLDAMLAVSQDKAQMLDAVESKLFGSDVEACTVGSHEFYMGYVIRRGTLLCLDMGHFHPTENIADKLSSLALSLDEILLHVSRPMRWDSDQVILLNEDLLQMAQELVSVNLLDRTDIGLGFFDATISRSAAWLICTRNMQKARLRGLLMPLATLEAAESKLDFTTRLTVTEEFRDMPFGAVWNEFAAREDVPNGQQLIKELDRYQARVSGRLQGSRSTRLATATTAVDVWGTMGLMPVVARNRTALVQVRHRQLPDVVFVPSAMSTNELLTMPFPATDLQGVRFGAVPHGHGVSI